MPVDQDQQRRAYVPGTSIEVIHDPPRGGFRHALFDFDGTISLLRHGWQGIMEPVMVEMICGDYDPPPEVVQEVRDYIDESTGIQTLIQMEHLVTLVEKHGFVPKDQILNAHGYKEIYNNRLMEPVRERLARLESRSLAYEDVTVRGSRQFVHALAERGLTLYIFSGTDRHDVQNEAEKLGVASYFNEIWGALPSIEEYSKEKVLREVMDSHDLNGEHVLIVGDGPVEIRNGKDYGCVTLGVASNEDGATGCDETKRKRLLTAGADLLVPDFAETEALLGYLFPV